MVLIEFNCKQEKLEHRICRITHLAGQARKFMEAGNESACIAKYYAMDIELGRLVNLTSEEDQARFSALTTSEDVGKLPGK